MKTQTYSTPNSTITIQDINKPYYKATIEYRDSHKEIRFPAKVKLNEFLARFEIL